MSRDAAASSQLATTAVGRSLQVGTRRRRVTGFRGFARRLSKTRLAPVALAVIVVLILAALLAPVIAPYPPDKPDFGAALEGPSGAHWFGADNLGRDIFTRVVYGSRVSLQVGIIAVSISLVIGTTLGLVAGYSGVGLVDTIIMRCMDALLAFPTLVLALAITAALGPSLTNVMIAVGVVGIPAYARLVRGQVLSVAKREYVEAARAMGAGSWRIMLIDILPNVIAPIIVYTTLLIPTNILFEAALSFLGVGIRPPTATWGGMLSEAVRYYTLPHFMFWPGMAIFITVLAFNLFGDGLRDALDPKTR